MKKRIVKATAFCVIFVMLFLGVSKVMTAPDYRNYQWIAGFYEEDEDSLDAIYLGSSNCYAFWNAMTAWQEYGIAVWPYSTNLQPFIAAEYMIRETRKTQPNAVYVVNVNTINERSASIEEIHHTLDYMPFSMNKVRLIEYLAEVGEYSLDDKLELYFPLLRYHDRWNELVPDDFDYQLNGFKGASRYDAYLKDQKDITEKYYMSEGTAELDQTYVDALNSLLDYCDREQVKVLFVTVPRGEKNTGTVKQINRMNQLIEERGYPTLYLNDKLEEIGLDVTTDYYNKAHTNVHGSIKFTRYVSERLIELFGFEDKRGEKEYADWDDGWTKYHDVIDNYVLDIELAGGHRAKLEAVSELGAVSEDGEVTVSWGESPGADGYAVYRKISSGAWERLAVTDGLFYTDTTAELKQKYSYAVVPYYEQDGESFYGDFAYKGVSITVK